jgi:hypothetical protein
LDLFPRELAAPLGALARPLDALIGPLRDRRRRGADGEPDGYADISRRGPYERLLLSEWLLATEEPDEWTRRAIAGEHAFLEISRREPVADRLSAVLFDAGPSQWGSARLAHLAALIVLSRRARAAGARFAWGVLQQTPPAADAPLWDDVTEAGVLRLLRAASAREANEADLSAWRERLGSGRSVPPAKLAAATHAPELWVVGAARLAPLLAAAGVGASLLTVREPLDAADGAETTPFLVANATFGPDSAPRVVATDVRLPLPEPDDRVRLLRDPFAARVHNPVEAVTRNDKAERGRDTPVSDLLFSLHGSKLFARGGARGGTTLLVYPLGNSPAANVNTPPKQYRSQFGTPFFAAGRVGQVTYIASLTSDGSAVRVESIGKGNGRHWAGSYRLTAPVTLSPDSPPPRGGPVDPERLRPIVPLYRGAGLDVAELVTILPDERIVRLNFNEDSEETGVGVGQVIGMRCLMLYRAAYQPGDKQGVVLAAHMGRSFKCFLLRDAAATGGRMMDSIGPSAATEADVDPLLLFDDIERDGPVAVLPSPDAEEGMLLVGSGHYRFALPHGTRLIGVERRSLTREADYTWFLLLSEDRRTISTARSSHPEAAVACFTAPEAIVRITKSPYARLLGYVTEAGTVGVWSLEYGDHVYHRLAPPPPGGRS